MTFDFSTITNQAKLQFLCDAVLNGGSSLFNGQSLEAQIANGSWDRTIQRTVNGKVVDITTRQELADCKTMLISQQAAITALQAQVAAIKPVDPDALNAAVAAAVKANPPVVDVAAIADAVEARTKDQYNK